MEIQKNKGIKKVDISDALSSKNTLGISSLLLLEANQDLNFMGSSLGFYHILFDLQGSPFIYT